ncbi:MAG: TIGR03084 family metal-binding protein [Acidimicrobiales bacterium]
MSGLASSSPERLATIREDLEEEQRSLELMIEDLSDEQWRLPTASAGWDVADQVAHLAYFDASAALAILDPERFHAGLTALYEGVVAIGIDEFTLGPLRALAHDELLNAWRQNRDGLLSAAAALKQDDRIAWYGPAMSAASFLTSRLMETWAHGVDVAEALGVSRESSDRLSDVAQLGFMTRPWSYQVRGEDVPAGRVRLELVSPSGDLWTWGDDDANDVVRGRAEEFCLVVTQRRHLDDTSLVTGELGRHWLIRAQAFAGGPSNGPQARST